jgi:hypothetical protein
MSLPLAFKVKTSSFVPLFDFNFRRFPIKSGIKTHVATLLSYRVLMKSVHKIAKGDLLHHVCLSARVFVRPHVTTLLPLGGFSWNFTFECFLKIFEEIQVSLKFDYDDDDDDNNNNRYFT